MPEHTIAENLTRLQNAKTAIGNAITAKGGTVAASDGLEDFSADIASITNQYTSSDEGKVVDNGQLVAQTAYPSTITENGIYDTTLFNSVTVNASSNQLVIPCSLPALKNSPKDAIAFITIDKTNKKLNFLFVAGETTPSRKVIITNNYGDTYEFVPQITLSDLINSISQYPDYWGYGWGTDTSGTDTTNVVNAPSYSQLSIDLTNNKIIYTPTGHMYNHVMLFYSYSYT